MAGTAKPMFTAYVEIQTTQRSNNTNAKIYPKYKDMMSEDRLIQNLSFITVKLWDTVSENERMFKVENIKRKL